MKTFTNEECQVIVHAIKGLAESVKVVADHIRVNLHEETFQHYADSFKESGDFAKRSIFQLNKIQKRLQSK